jgi:hypothetical protein
MKYRKIGGLHWLSIGRLRISWCVVKPIYPKYIPLPKATPIPIAIDDHYFEERLRRNDINTSIAFRKAMNDAGRGRLLR